MNSDSDDEFGDGNSLEYNEAFEAQMRILEGQVPITPGHPFAPDHPESTDIRVPPVRRKLDHLEISLEDDVADDEAVDVLIGDNDQALLDVLSIPASQTSKYEEDLVQQVSSLMPAGAEQVTPLPHDECASVGDSGCAPFDGILAEDETKQVTRRKKSLFEKFRKRGFFSVTDLVSPSWCEVQFDYRLRSKSYLPVAARPDTITTSTGTVIAVNKDIAGTGEKIMRKGEQVHKKLEREIHPVEIQVKTESREDVWGLRLLNMFASLEALMTLGKCRELPVVGFVRGYMIVGVIDEITRQPLISYTKKKSAPEAPKHQPPKKTSSKQAKIPTYKDAKAADQPKSSPQKTLFAFYRPLRSTPKPPPPVSHERTHVLYVSDSKTRAGGTMPKEENSVSGKMQLMLYKEMLDGMIVEGLRQHAIEEKEKLPKSTESDDDIQVVDMPTDDDIVVVEPDPKVAIEHRDIQVLVPQFSPEQSPSTTHAQIVTALDRFTWQDLFEHLSLNANEPFTKSFLEQSHLLVQGNNMPASVATACTLQDMTSCWAEYVAKLGLGTIGPSLDTAEMEGALQKETGGRKVGRSEKLLTLVYRHVGRSKKKTRGDRSQDTRSGPKSKRDKRRKRERTASEDAMNSDSTGIGTIDQPEAEPKRHVEDENDRLLQLAIADSLATTACHQEDAAENQKFQSNEVTIEMDDEPLPPSLVPPEVFAAHQHSAAPESQGDFKSNGLEAQSQPLAFSQLAAKPAEEVDGAIIGSHRFAYSPALLSDHIERILEFWTGSREPVGVSVENTTRCGWCEFEEGCEWRAAKAVEAANRNEGLQNSRRQATRPCNRSIEMT